jgi:hypothetical protein
VGVVVLAVVVVVVLVVLVVLVVGVVPYTRASYLDLAWHQRSCWCALLEDRSLFPSMHTVVLQHCCNVVESVDGVRLGLRLVLKLKLGLSLVLGLWLELGLWLGLGLKVER